MCRLQEKGIRRKAKMPVSFRMLTHTMRYLNHNLLTKTFSHKASAGLEEFSSKNPMFLAFEYDTCPP
jgi:hypothetical protein